MPYTLAPGISFCRVAGRAMFLDTRADRYFCLPPEAEAAFIRLVDDETSGADDLAILDRLAAGGPLRRSSCGDRPCPCTAPPIPRGSIIDAKPGRTSPVDLLAAALQLWLTPILLKRFGFGRLLGDVAARKARTSADGVCDGKVARVAAAFEKLRTVATTNDRCLVRSIAVARRLLAIGARPTVVIGVKLQPFRAHCWVQYEARLINDRIDVVRDFTPILVL